MQRFANVLKDQGVKKGDRVTIYMPMILEAAYAMLACTRIGAVHSIVFGGFSPDALAGRILDCDSKFVITADEGVRGGRPIPLKENTDDALDQCPDVQSVIVVEHTGGAVTNRTGMSNTRGNHLVANRRITTTASPQGTLAAAAPYHVVCAKQHAEGTTPTAMAIAQPPSPKRRCAACGGATHANTQVS